MKQLHIITIIFLAELFITACSSGDDTSSTKLPTTGEITISPGGDTATPQNPAQSSAGNPATVTLSQNASYQDPNGSIYLCEPKAVVTLTTDKQEVKVKNLSELTSISQNISQTQKGQNPVTYITTQSFTLGGQTLAFNLSHEVYTYTTSTKQKIEMPYLKLSAAKNGAARTETRNGLYNEVAVTGIRLVPITTRGSFTTEKTYEVHVSFTIDVNAMNTTISQSQTLCFEAIYVGVVETTTEYADPQTSLSYTIDSQGTTNTTSPFAMNGDTRQMTLEWNQIAQYTYFAVDEMETKVITREPKAKVTLTMQEDTVWVGSKSELETVTPSELQSSTTGSEPAIVNGKQEFEIGGQKLTIVYCNEIYGDVTVEGNVVSMPYLELSKPEVESVTSTVINHATINGVNVAYYEVAVKIVQELKSVNSTQPKSERVEYIVKYIGAETAKLVKVTYRKDWEWEEPHDNIILALFPVVHRDRTYSTGETFTDTFVDKGRFPGWTASTIADNRYEGFICGESISEYGDSVLLKHRSIGVPDLSRVEIDFFRDNNTLNEPVAGTWSEYRSEKSYVDAHVDISLDDVSVVGADSISSQPSGWYCLFEYMSSNLQLFYDDENCEYPYFAEMGVKGVFADQYLVIDGQMINFLEFRGPYEFSHSEEETTLEDGSPAKVYTIHGENVYFGKHFSGTTVITVYENKKDTRNVRTQTPSMNSQLHLPFAKYTNPKIDSGRPLHVITNNPWWKDTPNVIRHKTEKELKAALQGS